jgi:hypothetical protein
VSSFAFDLVTLAIFPRQSPHFHGDVRNNIVFIVPSEGRREYVEFLRRGTSSYFEQTPLRFGVGTKEKAGRTSVRTISQL